MALSCFLLCPIKEELAVNPFADVDLFPAECFPLLPVYLIQTASKKALVRTIRQACLRRQHAKYTWRFRVDGVVVLQV